MSRDLIFCKLCNSIVYMLVRAQILLEKRQKIELEKLAMMKDVSFSEIVRQGVPLLIEKHNQDKKSLPVLTQAQAIKSWFSGAVYGPGDSEYDKYAYEEE